MYNHIRIYRLSVVAKWKDFTPESDRGRGGGYKIQGYIPTA